MMDLKEHVKQLAAIEPDKAPFVSVYLNLDPGEAPRKKMELFLKQNVARFWDEYPQNSPAYNSYQKSWERIERFLHHEIKPASKGAAVFSRWKADDHFFLPLQFPLPVENRFTVDSVPHIFPLIQLLDKPFHYMVMISDSQKAQLFEVQFVNIRDLREIEQLADKKQFRGEWTQLHYQNWKKDKERRFIKTKLKVLENLMREKGINHLVLAGDNFTLTQIKHRLSKWLQERVVTFTSLDPQSAKTQIISRTLEAFAEYERGERISAIEALHREVVTNGLGVVGIEKTLVALNFAKADQLVIDTAYQAPLGWRCESCCYLKTGIFRGPCPECGSSKMVSCELRDEMARRALLIGANVETVEGDEWLIRNGGVGALLRFR